jgi:hypothetical protein
MLNNYTHISFVIDRSGSMQTIKNDTIGGFNQFLNDQKNQSGKCTISFYQFDDNHEKVHDFKPIEEVPDLDEKTFVPSGGTALLDAVGRAVSETGEKLASLDESERPEKVIVVIVTDGMENASTNFSYSQIKDMIAHQENTYNWKFVFLGANQDAIKVGASMGVSAGTSMSYAANSVGVQNLYASTSGLVSSLRSAKSHDLQNISYSQKDRDNAVAST